MKDSKGSVAKSDVSDTIDNFIKEEQREVEFISAYEKRLKNKGCKYTDGPSVQEVYGCLTCGIEGGICGYCSIECHENHEVFEVGLRANFTCDCPTEKFPGECKHIKNQGLDKKYPPNTGNVYNQNFQAKFCSCHKQILTEEEDMMQCPLCGDYFHPACQAIPISLRQQIFHPEKENPFSFVCRDCFNSKAGKALRAYPDVMITTGEEFDEALEEDIDSGKNSKEGSDKKTNGTPQKNHIDREKLLDLFMERMSNLRGMKGIKRVDIEVKEKEPSSGDNKTTGSEETKDQSYLGKRAPLDDNSPEPLEEAQEKTSCEYKRRLSILNSHAMNLESLCGVFFKENLYDHVCKCQDCEKMYREIDPYHGLLTDRFYEDENLAEVLKEMEISGEGKEQVTKDPNFNYGNGTEADHDFLNYMKNKFKEKAGREINPAEQLMVAEHYSQLKANLGEMIRSSGKSEITEADIVEMIQRMGGFTGQGK